MATKSIKGSIKSVSVGSKKDKDGNIVNKLNLSIEIDDLKDGLNFVRNLDNNDYGILDFEKSQMSIDDKIDKK